MAENFQCGYCGAAYDTPISRARCEFECDEKKKQEEERHRDRLKKEHDSRREEVVSAGAQFSQLCRAYTKDYGVCIIALLEDVCYVQDEIANNMLFDVYYLVPDLIDGTLKMPVKLKFGGESKIGKD